ncbi:MAG: 3-phenylpropionate/cinnamic acid dioxygenase subunit beta [Rhodospirillaceae bacterium]|nr:3-phenylpropionate/cinnamic acid dioxygenase subunit beta [Rhodospirillaceae bacterium]
MPDRDQLLDSLLLRYEVEQFYTAEAELLDNRQFDAWLDLLSDDIRYWMPLATNQEIGHWDTEHSREGKDLNWFDEGKFELEQRVKQLHTGLHWAEEPISRTCHMYSNLSVEAPDAEGTIHAATRFLVYRNRTEVETDFYVGKRRDCLRRDGNGALVITRREILLDQSVLLAKTLTTFF